MGIRLSVASAAAALLFGGCATRAPDGAAPGPTNGLESRAIAMSASHFGKVTSYWRIEPDGSGEYWREIPGSGAPGAKLEKYRGRLPAEHRAALLRGLERFRSGAIGEPPCPKPIHDAPGLAIRWGGGAKDWVSFYSGCLDPASIAYGKRVYALDAIVNGHFERQAPPYAVEHVEHAPAY